MKTDIEIIEVHSCYGCRWHVGFVASAQPEGSCAKKENKHIANLNEIPKWCPLCDDVDIEKWFQFRSNRTKFPGMDVCPQCMGTGLVTKIFIGDE